MNTIWKAVIEYTFHDRDRDNYDRSHIHDVVTHNADTLDELKERIRSVARGYVDCNSKYDYERSTIRVVAIYETTDNADDESENIINALTTDLEQIDASADVIRHKRQIEQAEAERIARDKHKQKELERLAKELGYNLKKD